MVREKKDKTIILGIDPGTTVMGFGVLEVENNRPKMLAIGVLELKKYKTHYDKLQCIFTRVLDLVDEYKPDVLAIEAPFFGKNIQSMLKLGRAQGAAMCAALYRDVPIQEYAPLKIKMAISGTGSASKEQISDLLKRFLKIPEKDMHLQLDATDGLAAAYCHYLQMSSPILPGKSTSWKAFAQQHSDRLKGL